MYHAAFNDTDRNGQPKVIVDVSAVSSDDEMLKPKPFSIHRPSKKLCRRIDQMLIHQVQRFPLVVSHYIGTYERYYVRNDTRRSRRAYDYKASVRHGKSHMWISEWVDGFVRQMGPDKAALLLNGHVR